MALEVITPRFRIDVNGAWRTRWHYRTTHEMQDVLDAGDRYWLRVADMVQPGDTIEVEDENLAWMFEVSVVSTKTSGAASEAEIIVTLPIGAPVIRDQMGLDRRAAEAEGREREIKEREARAYQERIESDRRQAEAVAAAAAANEAEQAAIKGDVNARADDPENQPAVAWKGPKAKWSITAFGSMAAKGFETKGEAEIAKARGDADAEIEKLRAAWVENNKAAG